MIGIFGEADIHGLTRPLLGAMGANLPMETALKTAPIAVGDVPLAGLAVHYHTKAGHGGLYENGAVHAAAIGIIHNPDDLAPGASSVAELVARLYREKALDRLADANGSFAAALFDSERRSLVLITDRLASYPIHLAAKGTGWVFGSSIYALVKVGAVAPRMSRDGLAQLFTMQRTVGRSTNIAGLEALPAGCITELTEKERREQIYWHLAWKPDGHGKTAHAERLSHALRAAVARQTADPSSALLLSGGIDSRLIIAAAPEQALACWTTASFDDNPELAIARRTASLCNAPFNPAIVEPSDTLDFLEPEVRVNNGLYPASLPIAAFMPQVGAHHATALTGHGLDYTLRGYYLPARFLSAAGSKTRLPMIRGLPDRPTAAFVLDNLRQGPPKSVIEKIVRPEAAHRWWSGQTDAMAEVLDPHLQSAVPVNAWDAFILHAVSKHYAFTGMMAVRAHCHLNMPAFDRDVFDVYLSMKPEERVGAEVVRLALQRLSPEVARLPNANSGFRADLPLWTETAAILGRAAARRLGLAKRPDKPTAMHSTGSWQSIDALFAHDPRHRERFIDIRGRLDQLSMATFDTDHLAGVIDEHLEGRAKHTKLLRQLLSHDAWVQEYGIEGHD